jgi:hypothetical protein
MTEQTDRLIAEIEKERTSERASKEVKRGSVSVPIAKQGSS